VLGVGRPSGVAGLPEQKLGPGVQPLRVGAGVQLHGEVGAREGQPRARGGRRARRIGDPLGPAQLVHRTLELPLSGERAGQRPPHGQGGRQRAGALVDRERLTERGAGGGVIPAAQLQLPQPVERIRRVRPLLTRPPRRQRVAVQALRPRKVTVQARQAGEVHEVRRRHVVASFAPIDHQRCLELTARFRDIARGLGQQAEVVVVGSHAAGVPDALAAGQRRGVAVPRRGEVAAVLPHRSQRADRIRRHAHVADPLRQGPRVLQVRHRAVELPGGGEARPDVAEDRRDRGCVANRLRAPQRAPPHHDRGRRPVPAVHGDTGPPHAVHPDFPRLPLRRPSGEARHLAHQEGVAPRDGIGRAQPSGDREILAVQGERDGLTRRRGSGPRLRHERRCRQPQGELPQRVGGGRLQRERGEQQRGHRRGAGTTENAVNGEVVQRSHPMRASTLQR